MPSTFAPKPRPVALLFATLAIVLLALTLAWQIPMMLWDHLDLVPMYQAWQRGDLADSGFAHIHGGHLHTAAYAVLLLTTKLSGGHPWLDGLCSWLLLVGYAAVVLHLARESFAGGSPSATAFTALITFLALFPGHLANLQWGWQVAVFLCLLGSVLTIACLTRAALTGWHLCAALAATLLALSSFATAAALLPTALLLVALRIDQSRQRRVACALPWLMAIAALVLVERDTLPAHASVALLEAIRYVLNFLGAGIARFATDVAPWLALAALGSAAWAAFVVGCRREALPWLGLVVFALIAAALTALGRVDAFGSDQAFVTRYVSFSSMFWIGWSGLVGSALTTRPRLPAAARIGVALVALLAFANALHLIGKARTVALRTHAIAQTIRDSYPHVDRALLGEIYFDQPDIAQQRLDALHALGFAPFASAPATPAH